MKWDLKYNENYAVAYYNLGRNYRECNQYKNAIYYYEKAVSVDPEYKRALAAWGFALNKIGDSVEAAEKYEAAVRIEPSFTTMRSLGVSYRRAGRFREAIQIFTRVLNNNDSDKDDMTKAHLQMGIVYYERSTSQHANEDDIERAVHHDIKEIGRFVINITNLPEDEEHAEKIGRLVAAVERAGNVELIGHLRRLTAAGPKKTRPKSCRFLRSQLSCQTPNPPRDCRRPFSSAHADDRFSVSLKGFGLPAGTIASEN